MAKVYLAIQESLQRPVAVKLLNNPESPDFHERFMNEGRYLAALSHSNIVEVYDVGECNGQYYILMEYLPRGDLKRRIRKGIKPATAIKLILKIANCLDYLHDQGIVHRDLKPSNILFRADNNPVLTDFGIAKLLQDSSELTLGGSILGSPSYLSPEQAGFSDEIDGRSDLYSLGVILYEMLVGRRPFTGENFATIIMAHLQDPIPKLPEQFSRFQPVIERLLAKRAEDRFQTGAELIQAIRSKGVSEVAQDVLLGDLDIDSESEPTEPVSEDPLQRPPSNSLGRRILSICVLLIVGLLPVYSLNQEELDGKEWKVASLPSSATPSQQAKGRDPLVRKNASPRQTDSALTQKDPTPRKVDSPSRKSVSSPRKSTSLQHKPRARQLRTLHKNLNKIDQLLVLAYKRMDSLRLSYPKGDSALKYFRDILELEPNNMAAQAGIRQIVRWYAKSAEEALDKGNLKLAKRYINRGLEIDGEHPTLVALQERVATNPRSVKQALQSLQLLQY